MINYKTYTHPTSNEWITFVHGAIGSQAVWDHQIPILSRYFNLITLDLRGHGDSSPYTKGQEFSLETMANDIINVLDTENIKKTHFVGASISATIIRKIAENHSERVEKLIMVSAIVKVDALAKTLLFSFWLIQFVLPRSLFFWLFSKTILIDKEVSKNRKFIISEALKMKKGTFSKWLRLMMKIDPLLAFYRITDLRKATLYLMGSKDKLFVSAVTKHLSEHHFSTIKLLECGHGVEREAPEDFNKEVIQFLLQKS